MAKWGPRLLMAALVALALTAIFNVLVLLQP